jgi:hypothetical protein
MANKPVLQGGVQNYLGKQKQVTAPVKWKSSPDHPETELAYITKAEKDLLVKSDLHGSLKGGVNKGPSGIMSLNGYGSADESQNVSGAAASAAERGGGSGRDRAEVQAEFQRGSTGPALAPGAMPETARDFRSAAIAAGAGQRVNPGFFDSKNVISPEELARARAFTRDRQNLFAKQAMRRTRGGGLMNFITGGGFTGNLIRGLGRLFGLGKDYDEPTYDMRQFSGINPTFQDDLDNELALSTVGSTNTVAPLGAESSNRFLGFPIGTGTNTTGPVVTDNRITTGVAEGPYSNMLDYLEVEPNVGLMSTQTFKDSPFAQADFTDYMGNYTNMMENNVPVSQDEQMFIDNEIANRRFP